jgi:hypothetical protein
MSRPGISLPQLLKSQNALMRGNAMLFCWGQQVLESQLQLLG